MLTTSSTDDYTDAKDWATKNIVKNCRCMNSKFKLENLTYQT
jgi:hypothetical protein